MRKGRDAKEERQDAATLRAASREALGDKNQLAKLEKNGHGHCKEAKRLRKILGVKEDGEGTG